MYVEKYYSTMAIKSFMLNIPQKTARKHMFTGILFQCIICNMSSNNEK